ncbi:TAT-variant-translocated molybdopterin oxidoreductase [Rhodothermus bifroesti]|nr:TAT-variant-translocated molybdopterin oxidoreductase [Rhodothermus bifroesti]GBD01050.1 Menaquinone reductase, iron-sulfur cluster-binding subunit [bacterium HR18]
MVLHDGAMIELPVVDASSPEEPTSGKRLWRSLRDLQRDPEWVQLARDEFMPGATEPPSGTSRRQFLQLMGASIALAGLTACRRPVEKILPYVRQPEQIIPGIPLYYATAMPFRGSLRPLLVESHEGRPTKIEGNPDHPISRGATGVFEQASLLNLYDPDRSQRVLHRGQPSSWADFVQFAQRLVAEAGSKRIAVLCEPSSSPTLAALRQELARRYAQVHWIEYAAEGDDNERLGLQQAFGQPVRARYRFSEARVIVSLDADFLGPTDRNFVENTREFAASRRIAQPGDEISRLYVVESAYTITGAMADHRLRLRASDIPAFAAALAAELGIEELRVAGARFASHPYVVEIARELREAGSRGVVLAGETQPPVVHALCAVLNDLLGSLGRTVTLHALEVPAQSQAEALATLMQALKAGEVDVLVLLNVNPVYDAPAALGFAEALAQVPEVIHLGLHVDETAQQSTWHLPAAHYLEAWGDGRAYDGTLSVIQPLIAPLYADAHSAIEVVALLASGQEQSGYDLVRNQWRVLLAGRGSFEQAWQRVLHDGFLPDSAYPTVSLRPTRQFLASWPTTTAEGLEVVFRLDPTVLDGSFANNAWCQELPDPMTKIVWDNVAILSPKTAEQLGITQRYHKGAYFVDVLELTLEGRSVALPAWILPGHPDQTITVNLGYGRQIRSNRSERKTSFFDLDDYTDIYNQGAIATGVGVNVAPLRRLDSPYVAQGVQLRKTGQTYKIVTTQDHGAMEGRPLVRMATLEEFRKQPKFAQEAEPPLEGLEPWAEYPTLWEERHPSRQPDFQNSDYYRNQWGMVIDLNACTGCNACVVACNSENNIVMVGKREVGRGREMHWLRIDRYFVSDEAHADNPQVVVQPVPCMHCENAPCESVCPVAATMHSPDGLNEMVYNRCIGTRYCSNNCPYKVRRFNWFNWVKTLPIQVQMAQNPDVTMRFRGVMEKCTYCVQRIREAQRQANVEQRPLRDGEVKTACQQACPAEAISFGDLNDPNSKVSRDKQNVRRYEMLAYLNVKPRTSYLARVTNPNPRLLEVETIA